MFRQFGGVSELVFTRLKFVFSLISKKRTGPIPKLPAFSEKLLERRSGPSDELTNNQIINFDKYYRRRRVEDVNLNNDKPIIRFSLRNNDVSDILNMKIKTYKQLVNFVKLRRGKFRPQEIMFCLQRFEKQDEVEIQKEILDIIQEAMETMKSIPPQYTKRFLEFAIINQIKSENIFSKLLGSYLKTVSANQNAQIDIELVRSLPYNMITHSRKLLIQLSKRQVATAVELFNYLCENDIRVDEIKSFDKWLVSEFSNLTLQQKLYAMEGFGNIAKKGIFVEMVKSTIESDLNPTKISDVIQLAVILTELGEVDQEVFASIEGKLIQFLQEGLYTQTDLNIVIQVSHRNCTGSLEFWTLVRQLYTKQQPQYSQLFAILGGLERNFQTDQKLFVRMIALDSHMEALNLDDENDFLKLMLVYFGNLRVMIDNPTNHKEIILKKLKVKLLEVYKEKRYKTFTMMFLWLLETDPIKKQEYFKLIYTQPEEQELFDIMRDPTIINPTAQTIAKRYDYFSINPVRGAIEIFIRKRKVQFEGKATLKH